ncbi:MAG: hypothetical protein HOV70_23405 [Streptomyces sp.]|nr:hypothetical protein [Streptomyces sp.]
MSAPLVINLRDGSVWERRAMSQAGVALYALAGTCACPEYVMASEAELAELGIVGSADVLPMPVGPEPRTEVERLAKRVVELQEELHTARFDAARARLERDVIRERVSEPFGCAHCGVVQRVHGRRYVTGAGMHGWERPSEEQVKDRMLARRAARGPVSEAELDSGVEELSADLRVRLALASAQRGRREARARVAELEAAAVTALPWAHSMSDDDLHGFLGDLVSAAMGRWQHSPEVPDREVLAAVEKACAAWRTPGEGYRSDEANRVVAYQAPGSGHLFCTGCGNGSGIFTELTSDELPDGGLCDICDVDVLIPREAGEPS